MSTNQEKPLSAEEFINELWKQLNQYLRMSEFSIKKEAAQLYTQQVSISVKEKDAEIEELKAGVNLTPLNNQISDLQRRLYKCSVDNAALIAKSQSLLIELSENIIENKINDIVNSYNKSIPVDCAIREGINWYKQQLSQTKTDKG